MTAINIAWLRARPKAVIGHLASRPTHRRLLVNVAWLVSDKVVRLIVAVWLGAWIARYLGPAQFGLLSYALALVALFAAFSTVGLPDLLVRDFVRHPERRARIMASALVLRLCGGLLTLTLAIGAVAMLRPGDLKAMVLVAIVAVGPLMQAIDVADVRYQAASDVRVIILLRYLAFAIVSALRIVALLMHAPLVVFALLTTLELVISAVLIWRLARFDGRWCGVADVDNREIQRLLREGMPLLVRALGVGIYLRIDQVMIGRLLDNHAVGIYAAASRLSEIWYLVPTAVMTALVPKLAENHQRNELDYEKHLTFVMRALVWSAIAFAAFVGLIAGPLIAGLYGRQFAGAAPVLALHAWASVAVTMGVVSSSWLINHGLARYGLYQAVAGAFVSVVGNLLLIPRLGIIGAAITIIVAQLTSAVFMNAVFAATRPVFRIQMRALFLNFRIQSLPS